MSSAKTAEHLRQMIAVLEAERQALATLDLDALLATAQRKQGLCAELEPASPAAPDAECRALAESARALNEVNRRVRNLLAAQVSARIDALVDRPGTYRVARVA